MKSFFVGGFEAVVIDYLRELLNDDALCRNRRVLLLQHFLLALQRVADKLHLLLEFHQPRIIALCARCCPSSAPRFLFHRRLPPAVQSSSLRLLRRRCSLVSLGRRFALLRRSRFGAFDGGRGVRCCFPLGGSRRRVARGSSGRCGPGSIPHPRLVSCGAREAHVVWKVCLVDAGLHPPNARFARQSGVALLVTFRTVLRFRNHSQPHRIIIHMLAFRMLPPATYATHQHRTIERLLLCAPAITLDNIAC
mmetsp:Transcript_60913/g.143912  ORF Transcript_60913/g.143912 Transcript_60913/m.143912 type:complete len:250 (-) Transcript_60913:337-1086(-)